MNEALKDWAAVLGYVINVNHEVKGDHCDTIADSEGNLLCYVSEVDAFLLRAAVRANVSMVREVEWRVSAEIIGGIYRGDGNDLIIALMNMDRAIRFTQSKTFMHENER